MKGLVSFPSFWLVFAATIGTLLPGPLLSGTPNIVPEQRSDQAVERQSRHADARSSVVRIDRNQQAALGLRTERLVQTRIRPRIKAYGQVMSPLALADAVAALRSAEATARASRNAYERARLLHDNHQNVSTEILERTEASAANDHLKSEQARQHILIQWGEGIAGRRDLDQFTTSLVSHSTFLVRIDLSPDQGKSEISEDALIVSPGTPSTPLTAHLLTRAPDINPTRQGPGYFFLAEGSSAGIAPGAFVVAYLHVPGQPRTGVLIPHSAVVHALGTTWVYLQRDRETFARLPVDLHDFPNAQWVAFNGPKAGEHVVVMGAQELWAEEFKVQMAESGEKD